MLWLDSVFADLDNATGCSGGCKAGFVSFTRSRKLRCSCGKLGHWSLAALRLQQRGDAPSDGLHLSKCTWSVGLFWGVIQCTEKVEDSRYVDAFDLTALQPCFTHPSRNGLSASTAPFAMPSVPCVS